jgi:uncharacterized membrane protein YgcG
VALTSAVPVPGGHGGGDE